MDNRYQCRICEQKTTTPLTVKVKGTIRALNNNSYTVWKCAICESLNALEAVDYAHIYQTYPFQNQKYDFITKKIFSKRMKILIQAGVQKNQSILDYGCGSGLFVRFLNENGFKCNGYEPFNPFFSSPKILSQKYDVVISQDVLEHVDNPHLLIEIFRSLTNEKGILIIGTPFADNVNIFNRIDQIGALHQPFHRFLISKKQINKVFSHENWSPAQIIEGSYADTWFPFINRKFFFNLFKSGGGIMDVAFEEINVWHLIKNPGLFFWGVFGNLFVKKQDVFIISSKLPNV